MPGKQQYESLLHTDQASHHLIIKNIAQCYFDQYGNAGQQSIEVKGLVLPPRHDGVKYYLKIRESYDWRHVKLLNLHHPP